MKSTEMHNVPAEIDKMGILNPLGIGYLCLKFAGMKHAYQEDVQVDVLEVVETTDLMDLVVFNDDVNTFEHVIDTLIRVCKHTAEQAEQCTLLIHHKGKCAVKSGTFDFLRPLREAICEAGIDARIL
jgi:ATP-dependent Clp protease adaptor protein ClpS